MTGALTISHAGGELQVPAINGRISSFTHIGSRPSQEDRFTIAFPLTSTGGILIGVFDGTVGDFASDSVKNLVLKNLLETDGWKCFVRTDSPAALRQGVVEMFLESDKELIELCKENGKNYASTTAVIVLVFGTRLVVSHVGDSRACLIHQVGENVWGEFLTADHRPDNPAERSRIEACGGSVVYLQNHAAKPFIRGGDFTVRKIKGDQPMQLQYSRAFGGKDLKPFGLSAEPDVSIFNLEQSSAIGVVLATDGLWDVLSPSAVAQEFTTTSSSSSLSESLVCRAINIQRSAGFPSDNVTAVCLRFK